EGGVLHARCCTITSCHSHGREAMLLHLRRGLYGRRILAIMHQESHGGVYVRIASMKSILVAYLLWLLGGPFFGLHKFYLGRPFMGLWFIFTFAGFFLGWFADFFPLPPLVQLANF